MTKIIIIVAGTVVVVGLITTGLASYAKMIRDADRAETLKKGVELVQQRDKIDAKLKKATAEDICRALGGTNVNGECI